MYKVGKSYGNNMGIFIYSFGYIYLTKSKNKMFMNYNYVNFDYLLYISWNMNQIINLNIWKVVINIDEGFDI